MIFWFTPLAQDSGKWKLGAPHGSSPFKASSPEMSVWWLCSDCDTHRHSDAFALTWRGGCHTGLRERWGGQQSPLHNFPMCEQAAFSHWSPPLVFMRKWTLIEKQSFLISQRWLWVSPTHPDASTNSYQVWAKAPRCLWHRDSCSTVRNPPSLKSLPLLALTAASTSKLDFEDHFHRPFSFCVY